MKYNSAILVLAYSTLISAGTSTILGAEAVCGDLGILQITPGNLPDGVEPSDLRLCEKGSGKWCWTATAGGVGPWARCKKWEDCGTNGLQYGCGKNCVLPGVCGCSC
ncbi:hypothetical protein Forpe1208_v004274 [Fusarium oxysporum f. sp. rapae]|uniref:Uncharacterized protein n=1 Tax=Fusarium oxysporum f. sp. rapae TaxID=485398 RepID=A0A8J5P3B5_FUSOX|nr:hypothetical protein Forpe1208_v004274 [Fusarium oxysporum f. sp. rapae]